MRNVNMIDVDEWDEIVKDIYGKPYSFQQQDDCKPRGIYEFCVPVGYPEDYENDTVPEKVNDQKMGVSFKSWLSRDPQKLISNDKWSTDLWWERNFYPNVDMVINDLYEKGVLTEGKYIINIDW